MIAESLVIIYSIIKLISELFKENIIRTHTNTIYNYMVVKYNAY